MKCIFNDAANCYDIESMTNGRNCGKILTKVTRRIWRKIRHTSTFSTTYPICTVLGLNPSIPSDRAVTNRWATARPW